tara:strand:+ start:19580 stop:19990 length:411 start_codon:yes stop_codon:yes gene_type:complete
MKMFCNFFAKPNFGLLLLRILLGAMMVMHGVPKFLGGSALLTEIGQKMAVLGITFAPLFWGFCAALLETLGGVLLVLGFLFRPTALLFVFMFTVNAYYLCNTGADFLNATAYPLEMAIVFLGLLFIGPGKLSVDKE